mgnify:CR=1 FL=1
MNTALPIAAAVLLAREERIPGHGAHHAHADVLAGSGLVEIALGLEVDGGQGGGLLARAGDGPDVLARASYDGRPGHPVLLGRHHWAAVSQSAVGDRGARDLLATSDTVLVECGDLATGADVDRPSETSGPTVDQRPPP